MKQENENIFSKIMVERKIKWYYIRESNIVLPFRIINFGKRGRLECINLSFLYLRNIKKM